MRLIQAVLPAFQNRILAETRAVHLLYNKPPAAIATLRRALPSGFRLPGQWTTLGEESIAG